MRIAFDLDNTLIRCGHEFPLEKPSWLTQLFGGERLRKGTAEAIAHCRQQGWEVWVYTTSFRSAWRIRRLVHYGIRLDGVVNQPRHRREVSARCTKHPPSFGIDLLIDDADGVRLEGERHGFRVLVVRPEDLEWVEKVRGELASPLH